MSARLLFIHCLSPLHAGTGQSIGAVDLPIAREVSTGLPFLPGPSIKGSLRDAARTRLDSPDDVIRLFGPETANAADHAGALAFGDGRLVCMPARSIHGTFAWATSPMLMQRLLRDALEAGLAPPQEARSLAVKSIGQARTTDSCIVQKNNRIIFEDLDFSSSPCATTTALAAWLAPLIFDSEGEQAAFRSRFVVLNDDAMSFLSRHAVDTVTRASIDPETKTVKRGQLWTEENLPTESILAALVADIPVLARRCEGGVFPRLQTLCKQTVQFGGHATIGRGRCNVRMQGGDR
ncbi:MAG: type III-B CRISPR module RAMP protein Cmr4 [Deltaproteobacteria bacterium]|nr:MAG: type III-B CRISPR module RAMP protein Cmr4 [Deltaproteobacteria bacterium]